MPEDSTGKVRIYPVTRIFGRAEIEVLFSPEQQVSGARLRALESRRIDRMVQGMPAVRAPYVVSRSCGPCGPFHLLASCMAIESASGVSIPPEAAKLRELLAWLLLVSSHLSRMAFMVLPDFALPMSDAGVKNVTGIYMIDQDSISRISHCLSSVNEAIRVLAGNEFRVPVIVPGGVSALPGPTDVALAARLLASCEDELRETVRFAEMLSRRESHMMDSGARIRGFFACSTVDGSAALIGDMIKVSSYRGDDVTLVPPSELVSSLRESHTLWSYVIPVSLPGKEPMIVGPLARVNAGFGEGAPSAGLERQRAVEQWQFPVASEFFHLMSLALESLWGWEKASGLLAAGVQQGGETCARLQLSGSDGLAVIDSPEGLLCHQVSVSAEKTVKSYRIVSPLQFNIQAINEHISRVAKDVVTGVEIGDVAASRLQLAARTFSPCIQCGTH